MMPKTKEWLDLAREDFDAAGKNFNMNILMWANIQAQQTVEKSLKAILCENGKIIPKTHDLVFLAKEAHLQEDLILQLASLTRIYLEMRYPNNIARELKILEAQQTRKNISLAGEILRWVEKKI